MLVAVAMMSLLAQSGHRLHPWGADNIVRERGYAAEIIALAPDIVLASGTLSATALQQVGHTVPIVFVGDDGLTDEARRPDRVHDSTRPGWRGICYPARPQWASTFGRST